MELTLLRTYHPTGTNGDLMYNSSLVCHTIELPWRNNQRRVSCIPEGRYQLKPFSSKKHPHVFEVCEVPNRDAILIHKANFALKELLGCIGPVMSLEASQFGVGWNSKKALEIVSELVWAALENDEEVYITIQRK